MIMMMARGVSLFFAFAFLLFTFIKPFSFFPACSVCLSVLPKGRKKNPHSNHAMHSMQLVTSSIRFCLLGTRKPEGLCQTPLRFAQGTSVLSMPSDPIFLNKSKREARERASDIRHRFQRPAPAAATDSIDMSLPTANIRLNNSLPTKHSNALEQPPPTNRVPLGLDKPHHQNPVIPGLLDNDAAV